MKLQRIINSIYIQPLMIKGDEYMSIEQTVREYIQSGRGFADKSNVPLMEHLESRKNDNTWTDWDDCKHGYEVDNNNIGHVYVSGALGYKVSYFDKACFGMTDYSDIKASIEDLQFQEVDGIIFHIDSPGGMVRGLADCADDIAAIEVPTIAIVDNLCASAAYYLAVATDHIYMTRDADIGCIGTILPVYDYSEYFKKIGINPEPIKNEGADYKDMFYLPRLTDKQRAYLQEEVDRLGTEFKNWIRNFRDVPEEAMKGQCYLGAPAIDVNLADEVARPEEAYESFLDSLMAY